MSVPARSATSRAAAGSICCPASATACCTSCSAVRATCRRSTRASLLPFSPQHSTIVRCFWSVLYSLRVRSTSAATNTSVVCGSGCCTYASSTSSVGRRFGVCVVLRLRLRALAAPLRLQDLLRAQHDDDAPVAHHRQRARRFDDRRRRDALLAGVDPLEVERAQLVLDQRVISAASRAISASSSPTIR